jgi:hypothetical protein
LDDVITDISKTKSLIPLRKYKKPHKNKEKLTLPLKVTKKRGRPKKVIEESNKKIKV